MPATSSFPEARSDDHSRSGPGPPTMTTSTSGVVRTPRGPNSYGSVVNLRQTMSSTPPASKSGSGLSGTAGALTSTSGSGTASSTVFLPSETHTPPGQDYLPPNQRMILFGATFLKGGLLGAYVPFIALWFYTNGFTTTQVGALSACDLMVSIVAVPLLGALLDLFNVHNMGLVMVMGTVG